MALCKDIMNSIFSFLCVEGTCKMMLTCKTYYEQLKQQREELKALIPWHISVDQSLFGPRNARVRFGYFLDSDDVERKHKSSYCVVAKGYGGPWLENMLSNYKYESTLYLSLKYEGRFWLPYYISKEKSKDDISFIMEKGVLQDVPYYYTVNIDGKRRMEEEIEEGVYLYKYK
jgi:hypothetical protein